MSEINDRRRTPANKKRLIAGVRKFLSSKGEGLAPREYTEYLLMKHVYHCTPSELDKQDTKIIDLHLAFMNEEGRAEKLRKNRAEQEAKTKRINNGRQ